LREGLSAIFARAWAVHRSLTRNSKLCQVSTMTVPPLVKQRAIASAIGFAAGALLWLLATQIYAKAQDEGVSVNGCEKSLGMDPMECA
jgi:L-cystine uptake protein TcyP (sodium:dicarboxylate symporter family)